MTDELLPYYNRELAYIRHLGAEFAESHPKIAARLRLSDGMSDDPHVARLIESFAFLNARIRHKLDDDFPEITEALLNVLYPHYLAPIPSMAIVQFVLDPEQGQLTAGYAIPRGAAVESEPIDGVPCRFRTCYPVTLWPFEVSEAQLSGHPFTAPRVAAATQAVAVLRIELKCALPNATFAEFECDALRFFISGQGAHVCDLYEALFNDVLGIALVAPDDRQPTLMSAECLSHVGFDRDESILPQSPRSFPGYGLLTEYFAFPAKFLFFDLLGLDRDTLARAGEKLEIYMFLRRSSRDLQRNVTRDTFRLGCTPIVNLFRQRAEPTRLDHTVTELRVVPDARRPHSFEVYSIDRVSIGAAGGTETECVPFYSVKHASSPDENPVYWYAARRPARQRRNGESDQTTALFVTLVQLDFSPSTPVETILDVETTCLNGDLPRHLPFGGGQPRLALSEGGPISAVRCLTAPTSTLRPASRHGTLWRLISHLSLNHLSISGQEQGAEALREILKLYDYADSPETRKMIDGIESVHSRRIVGRSGSDASGGFCRGIEVTIEFDEEHFTGSGVFLFATVLERFLGLYSSVNSFSKLIARTRQREGDLRRWSPRAGEQVLL